MGSSVQGNSKIIPMYRDIGSKNCPPIIDKSVPPPVIEIPIVTINKPEEKPLPVIKKPIATDKPVEKSPGIKKPKIPENKPPPVIKTPIIIEKPVEKTPPIIKKSKIPENKPPPVIEKPEMPKNQEKSVRQVLVAKSKLPEKHVSNEMIMVESSVLKRNSLWITPIPVSAYKDYLDSVPKQMFL